MQQDFNFAARGVFGPDDVKRMRDALSLSFAEEPDAIEFCDARAMMIVRLYSSGVTDVQALSDIASLMSSTRLFRSVAVPSAHSANLHSE